MEDLYLATLSALSLSTLDVRMIGVGLVFIVLLYKALERFVFDPHIQHLEHRESVTAGARVSAAATREKAAALRASYDQRLFEARVEATKERLAIVARARREATDIVSSAEAEAGKQLAAGREKIAQQIEDSRAKVEAEAESIAQMLATKVDTELTVH